MSKEEEGAIFTSQDLINYRESLGLTQEGFSKRFEIPLGTLRNWEQGFSMPNMSLAKLQLFNRVVKWKKTA